MSDTLESLQNLYDMGFIQDHEYIRRKQALGGGQTSPCAPHESSSSPVLSEVCRDWYPTASDLNLQSTLQILHPTPPRSVRLRLDSVPQNAIWWNPLFLASHKAILEGLEHIHIGRIEPNKDYIHPAPAQNFPLYSSAIGAILGHTTNLRSLSFLGSFPFDSRCLRALNKLEHLKDLIFQERELVSFYVSEFTSYAPPNLEKLVITRYSVHLSGLLSFLSGTTPLAFPSEMDLLRYPRYAYGEPKIVGWVQLRSPAPLNTLRELHFSACNLHSYYDWPPMPALKHLVIENCSIFGQPAFMLPLLESAQNLQTFSLYRSRFLDRTHAGSVVKQLMTVLDLVLPRVNDFGFSHPVLEESVCPLEDILAKLAMAPQLTSLKLSARIHDLEQAAALFSALDLPVLQSLELDCTHRVDGDDVSGNCGSRYQKFWQSVPLACPNVRELRIVSLGKRRKEKVELDDGALGSWKDLQQLEELTIPVSQSLTKEGLELLLQTHPTLRQLALGHVASPHFTETDVSMLQSKYSHVTIEYDPTTVQSVPEMERTLPQIAEGHLPDPKCGECELVGCPFGCVMRFPECVTYDHSIICTATSKFCPAGCGAVIQRFEFDDHSKECPECTVVCGGCKLDMKASEYPSHMESIQGDHGVPRSCFFESYPYLCTRSCDDMHQCPSYEIICPACRQEMGLQDYLSTHQDRCTSKKYQSEDMYVHLTEDTLLPWPRKGERTRSWQNINSSAYEHETY